jgi:NAD(P) transhydrogenase
MASVPHFDLIVIGGGPAGASGAFTAAIYGRRVALVERTPYLGGAGINTGTVPSKTLRETALALSGIRARRLTGLDLSLRREATISDFVSHERQVTANERKRLTDRLEGENVRILQGTARFVDPHTIALDSGERLTGDYILVATGSSPARPPEFPFADPAVHDSNEILDLDRLPRTLAVVGAGVIGSEYASTFAALGTRVWIIDGRDTLLPFLDREVADALEGAMRRAGIEFVWNQRVDACEACGGGPVTLRLTSGTPLEVEGVFVAAGRTSNTADLRLEAAGLTPGPRGLLQVDEHYRTTVPHILAAGDVIGFPALASTSLQQARIAVCRAFGLEAPVSRPALLPTGIYTIPEVSAIGKTEESLMEEGVPYVAGRAAYTDTARGDIMGDEAGFLKLLFRRSDRKLVGVHVIGEQATELVHIGLMALMSGADVSLLVASCFNFPTLGDLYRVAAAQALASIEGR